MATILAVARSRGGGDLPPLIAVAVALRERGHELVLCCDPAAARLLEPLGLRSIVDADGWRAADARAHATRAAGIARYFDALNAALIPVLDAALADARPDLMLTTLLTAPLIRAFSPAVKACAVNSTYYPRPDAGDAVGTYFGPILDALPFVLHATDAVFDGAERLPHGHHFTGPLFWEPRAAPPPYLDEPGDPWALVAVSSEEQGDLPIVSAALAALARHPVRVVATTPSAAHGGGVAVRPANARLEGWVSHDAVLTRSRLMVSHAGHGAVMRALWHGVPMVLVPWSRDQPGVARRAERLGVARVVPPPELASLHVAIDAVLSDPRYAAAAAAHSRRLRQTDPVEVACELVERALDA